MVYWGEEDKKQRLARKLREKKETRQGLEPKLQRVETVIIERSDDIDRVLFVLDKQIQANEKQGEHIKTLTNTLTEQQKLLSELINKQSIPGQYKIIYEGNKSEVQDKDDLFLPSIEDMEAGRISHIIDTSNISSEIGEVGQNKTEGKSIKDKANKLKELLKDKRGG